MAKYLLLFLQLNVIFRNLPFFFVLGCIISVVFPIMYPSYNDNFEKLQKSSNECMNQRIKQRHLSALDSSFQANSQECFDLAEAKLKNAAKAQK